MPCTSIGCLGDDFRVRLGLSHNVEVTTGSIQDLKRKRKASRIGEGGSGDCKLGHSPIVFMVVYIL